MLSYFRVSTTQRSSLHNTDFFLGSCGRSLPDDRVRKLHDLVDDSIASILVWIWTLWPRTPLEPRR